MTTPSIEGTDKLVRRELADGTVQLPPALKGMCTVTGAHRNFSVVWPDDDGRYYSEAYAARYRLAEAEYTGTSTTCSSTTRSVARASAATCLRRRRVRRSPWTGTA